MFVDNVRWCRKLLTAAIATLGFMATAFSAHADSMTVPVPRVTIYPGEKIDASMLTERVFQSGYEPPQGAIESESLLVGKVARRTLLPDQAIASVAVENPRLVTIGARVKIIFSENGVFITGFGVAQQFGALGDLVQVRNLDSGLSVVGRIQKDGSILVGEG